MYSFTKIEEILNGKDVLVKIPKHLRVHLSTIAENNSFIDTVEKALNNELFSIKIVNALLNS